MMHLTRQRVAGSRILALGLLLAALMGAWLVISASPAHAATLTVNSTGNKNDFDFPGGGFDGSSDGKCFTGVGSGAAEECTLRAAIQEANVTPGADTINFNIAGTDVKTISPTSELPRITGPVTIDGYSQPGAKPNTLANGNDAVLKIELRGPGSGYGLLINNAPNSTIEGLVINRWYHGIGVGGSGATGNKVTGNYIGTDASGTQDLGNGVHGVFIGNTPNNVVGGATPGERNVISGNDNHGVYISGATTTGNKVVGNYIGTDASGTRDLGNNADGVNIERAPNNTIGGTEAGERNIISGNNSEGVVVNGYGATGNKVMGNYVGTDSNGAADLGNTSDGVYVSSPNNTIGGATAEARNVISGNDSDGVEINRANATGNEVTGNYVGTDASGTKDLGNTANGVYIYEAPNNTIGGTTDAERNVVSGNDGSGVFIRGAGATGNKVTGNYVGADASGRKDVGNSSNGVHISAPSNAVGGTTVGERNVISGNDSEGVVISGAGAKGNKVTGNYVGTDSDGAADLGNSGVGVFVQQDASGNTVGGATAGERNVISGNEVNGVFIVGANATGNRVMGNYVGTDSNGTAPLGNSGAGVVIGFASNNTVGGKRPEQRNVITANDGGGVLVFGSNAAGNRVWSNSIFSNGLLGIDLNGDGPSANDPGDSDTGANEVQNKPVLSLAETSASSTTVQGTLNSTPNTTFRVQFFRNDPNADEGQTFLGQSFVTSDPSGNAALALVVGQALPVGETITATATNSNGSTSEFSAPETVIAEDDGPPTVKEVFPAEYQTGVYADENVSVFFSEEMDAATVNPDTVKLRKSGTRTSVPATVTYAAEGDEAILDPDVDLDPGAIYIAEVTAGATDAGGTALDQDPNLAGNQSKVWKFQVGV